MLAVTYFALVTTVIAIFARFALDMGWIPALMFGPMIVGTSSIVIIPLSRRASVEGGDLPYAILGIYHHGRS